MSATFTESSWFHDLSLFVSTTFMICVHNFPHGEVSVKVGVMEFRLYRLPCCLTLAALCSTMMTHALHLNWQSNCQHRLSVALFTLLHLQRLVFDVLLNIYNFLVSTCSTAVSQLMFSDFVALQGVPKTDPTCFCQNFVKSPPNLIIFGTQIAKTIEICKVHSLSTSPCLC